MKDRLLKFINDEEISATRFADEIGVQRSSISHILSGRNKPSYDFIQKILTRYPVLNAEWLLLGKGKMYKESNSGTFKATPSIQQTDIFSQIESNSAKSENEEEIQEEIEDNNIPSDLPVNTPEQNSTIQSKPSEDSQRLEKIILVYSNGTFQELKPKS
jgi:transcriptional regulator with XRE-family HTH domain